MADDEKVEDVSMTTEELMSEFFDPELEKLINSHMKGKQVMRAYVTLSYILGTCIARTSTCEHEAQHALDMCGAVATATIHAHADAASKGTEDDNPTHTPVSKLQ